MDTEQALLSVHIEEYKKIWGEVTTRFDNQRQAFYYSIIFIGAILTGAVANGGTLGRSAAYWVCVPLVLLPLACIFFDNELLIWGIVQHTIFLQGKVQNLLQSKDVLSMEGNRFLGLPKGSGAIHQSLSRTRWMIFILPSVASYVAAVSMFPNKWPKSTSDRVAITAGLALDLAGTVVVVIGMVASLRARKQTWNFSTVSRRDTEE